MGMGGSGPYEGSSCHLILANCAFWEYEAWVTNSSDFIFKEEPEIQIFKKIYVSILAMNLY